MGSPCPHTAAPTPGRLLGAEHCYTLPRYAHGTLTRQGSSPAQHLSPTSSRLAAEHLFQCLYPHSTAVTLF